MDELLERRAKLIARQEMAAMTLTPFFHPSMQIPFKLDGKEQPFKITEGMAVCDLMDQVEEFFEKHSAEQGQALELQINVLWNVKDFKKALNPNDKVAAHFVDGESFGIYGDIMPAQTPPIPETDKTPVVILTGFLGSGKTTLLNYMLEEQREKKIAVIENEFGEVSIDDALLKKDKMALAEKIVVMDNGCMCCTIRGDLISGLKEILNEMAKGAQIDLIAIETTGMADPVPIVRTFMSEPSLTEKLRLDGVVSLADAKNLPGRLDDDVEEGKVNEAYQQIAFADKIILNKLDLITAEQAIAVKDRIRDINKFARILPAVKSRIKLDELSNMRAHDMGHFTEVELGQEAEVDPQLAEGHGGHGEHGGHGGHGDGHGHDENCTEDHGGGHGGGHGGHGGHSEGHSEGHGEGHSSGYAGHGGGHGHGHGESRHDKRVNSFSIVKEGEILPRRLSQWMQSLGQLDKDKGTIFRIKAILAVKGHPYKHVFHAVMDISDEDDAGPWAEGEKKISKIVFIGKAMDRKFLTEGFEAIFEKEEEKK
jgi:G3E family GTPase